MASRRRWLAAVGAATAAVGGVLGAAEYRVQGARDRVATQLLDTAEEHAEAVRGAGEHRVKRGAVRRMLRLLTESDRAWLIVTGARGAGKTEAVCECLARGAFAYLPLRAGDDPDTVVDRLWTRGDSEPVARALRSYARMRGLASGWDLLREAAMRLPETHELLVHVDACGVDPSALLPPRTRVWRTVVETYAAAPVVKELGRELVHSVVIGRLSGADAQRMVNFEAGEADPLADVGLTIGDVAALAGGTDAADLVQAAAEAMRSEALGDWDARTTLFYYELLEELTGDRVSTLQEMDPDAAMGRTVPPLNVSQMQRLVIEGEVAHALLQPSMIAGHVALAIAADRARLSDGVEWDDGDVGLADEDAPLAELDDTDDVLCAWQAGAVAISRLQASAFRQLVDDDGVHAAFRRAAVARDLAELELDEQRVAWNRRELDKARAGLHDLVAAEKLDAQAALEARIRFDGVARGIAAEEEQLMKRRAHLVREQQRASIDVAQS